MLDIGWSEMLVIVVVAILVIGPRDLPGVLRTVGRWVGKVRSLSREFQRSLNDIARETEFDEVQRSIRDATNLGASIGKPGPIASGAAIAETGKDAAAPPEQAKAKAEEVEEAKPTESGAVAADPATADPPVQPAEPSARAEG